MTQAFSSFGNSLFPNDKSAQPYGGVVNSSTPFSSTTYGATTLDPSIRSLQDAYLNQLTGITSGMGTDTSNYMNAITGYQGTLGGINNRYLGNEGGLISAAVDPIKSAGASALGSAQRDMGLRGLGGSSFGYDQLSGMGLDIGRQIGDASASATANNLGFESNLAGMGLGAAGQGLSAQQNLRQFQAGSAGASNQVSMERLQQELSSLGLSQAQIGQLMSSYFNTAQLQQGLTGLQQEGTGMILKMFGGGGSKPGTVGTTPGG